MMGRRVKEFIDIREHVSLEGLIGELVAIRAALPANSEAQLKLRGDDIFGRRITISYFREQTAEEAAIDRRYAEAALQAAKLEAQQLREELAELCRRLDIEDEAELRYVA